MLLRTILEDEFRFLTFRAPSSAIREHSGAYLAFGLFLTWAAGVGRYWDTDEAALWQHLGLGSLAYAFLMALILWLLVAPLGPKNWSYRNVLLFVALTAPPALLYAVPVELWVSPATALAINSVFLAIVAAWRVSLLVVFLKRVACLRGSAILAAALLPLAAIVDVLAFLNLGDAVYATMAGLQNASGSATQMHYEVVHFISVLSTVMTPAILALYGWMAHAARAAHRTNTAMNDSRLISCDAGRVAAHRASQSCVAMP